MEKLLTLTLFIFILFAGCKKDKGDPPILPPEESMIIDFSNFENAKSADNTGIKGTENSSWEFASVAALWWKGVITATVAVPVTAFQMVIDQNPEYVSEKTWQWSYSATIAQAAYKARLTGQIKADSVEWKMYLTKEGTGGFTDFLWFKGNSAFDGKSGTWTLNLSNSNPVPVLGIEWAKTSDTQWNIKYSYIKNDNDPFKNSFIQYGLTSGSLNAYFTIQYWNGAKLSNVNIEWNTSIHNGRVKSIDYLGDDQWHCWDANKVNVNCQ